MRQRTRRFFANSKLANWLATLWRGSESGAPAVAFMTQPDLVHPGEPCFKVGVAPGDQVWIKNADARLVVMPAELRLGIGGSVFAFPESSQPSLTLVRGSSGRGRRLRIGTKDAVWVLWLPRAKASAIVEALTTAGWAFEEKWS